MKNYRTVAIVLIFLILLPVPAQAQVIPGRWEKVEALEAETVIIVNLKSWDRLEGQFRRAFPVRAILENPLRSGGDPES